MNQIFNQFIETDSLKELICDSEGSDLYHVILINGPFKYKKIQIICILSSPPKEQTIHSNSYAQFKKSNIKLNVIFFFCFYSYKKNI